eukprot:TRINITY_DN14184_c0_g1_i1.p1 TRINITY_DN14184_c0_g1~~TRINITY_DN14184_c0_g1_i1.p1  ORF type:complete len:257 (+),score=39.39 TRINITY_DN14184_c0_g1_i1:368-1138(+)
MRLTMKFSTMSTLHLKSFASKQNDPCGYILKEYGEYFIKYWKQHMWQKPKYSFGVSKTFTNTFTEEKHGYSGSIDIHTIGSHKTTTPLSIKVDVKTHRYHRVTMQNFGMFIRMEGVASKVVDKVRSFLSTGDFEFAKLKEILFTDMNIRQRSALPARICIIFTRKDNIVFEYHLVDSDILGIFTKLREFIPHVRSIEDVFQLNKYIGFAWDMFLYEQPTDFGVPMAYGSNAFSVFGLHGKARKHWALQERWTLKCI